MKLQIVSIIKINEKEINQRDLQPEVLQQIIIKKVNFAMENIGFERKETAWGGYGGQARQKVFAITQSERSVKWKENSHYTGLYLKLVYF